MAGTGHNTHPYMQYKMKNKAPGSIDPDDIILMRSSEMYLIEAEANVMQNDYCSFLLHILVFFICKY
jgi:hypothetical protein